MNKKAISAFLFLTAIFALGFIASCQSTPWIVTVTPESSSTLAATPMLITPTPSCVWPCESDSLTLTAARAIDYTATAAADAATCAWPCPNDSLTLTADASLTLRPMTGDLGWGAVHGKITDSTTGLPVSNAKITCAHSSYTVAGNGRCSGTTWTNEEGIYSFVPVSFHDTDVITLVVDAPGYKHLEFQQPFFTFPELIADLGLEPDVSDGSSTPTPTFFPMCTAPACDSGSLTCGDPNGCPGGCGTICATFTPTP